MDILTKYLINHAIGMTKGAIVIAIMDALQSTDVSTKQAAILAVVSWALGQLLGAEKGAATFSTISGLVLLAGVK